MIEKHEKLWEQFRSGSQGMSGKKTTNTITTLESDMWQEVKPTTIKEIEYDEEIVDSDEEMKKALIDV